MVQVILYVISVMGFVALCAQSIWDAAPFGDLKSKSFDRFDLTP